MNSFLWTAVDDCGMLWSIAFHLEVQWCHMCFADAHAVTRMEGVEDEEMSGAGQLSSFEWMVTSNFWQPSQQVLGARIWYFMILLEFLAKNTSWYQIQTHAATSCNIKMCLTPPKPTWCCRCPWKCIWWRRNAPNVQTSVQSENKPGLSLHPWDRKAGDLLCIPVRF